MIKKGLLFFLLIAACGLHAADEPFSILLTWTKDPSSTMTLTWITEKNNPDDLILYRQEGTESWERAAGFHFPMPENDPFYLHRIELTHLNPNTGYEFKLSEFDGIYKFKTIPDDPKEKVRFVVGGDMYHDTIESFSETNRTAAKQNPHFALIGGDIAYAHDKHTGRKTAHKERWYHWIYTWFRDMVTEDGYLIPVIAAIGNHDVSGRYNQNPSQSPYFYTLFAMPGIQGFNTLDFGHHLSLFILDSDHTHPVEGLQTNRLYHSLKKRETVPYKYAIYHVPAYPCVRTFNGKVSKKIRKYWVPLFEKFNLTAAFENHDHAYKRSPPIYQNKISPKGVLYIGDGAWGTSNTRQTKNPKHTWYLEKTASVRHFILVTIDEDEALYQAIDPKGRLVDQLLQYGPVKYPIKKPQILNR